MQFLLTTAQSTNVFYNFRGSYIVPSAAAATAIKNVKKEKEMNKIVNEYETSFYCILKNYVNTNAIGDRRGDININIPFSTVPITTWARVKFPGQFAFAEK